MENDGQQPLVSAQAQTEAMLKFIAPAKQRDDQGRFAKPAETQQAQEDQPKPQQQEPQPEEQQPVQQEPDEQGDVAEQAEPQKFKVKSGNEEFEVTIDEMSNGYLRNRDYTQKMQDMHKTVREKQTEYQTNLEAERKRYLSGLTALQQVVLRTIQPEFSNINWQQLATENPTKYVELKARADQVNSLMQSVQVERQNEERKSDEETAKSREKRLAEGYETLTKEIPNWSDEVGSKLFKRGTDTYKLSTKEDGEPLENPKWVKILHDAHQFQLLQEAKPMAEKKVQQVQATLKPGAREQKPNTKTQQVKAASERLHKTGRVDDLANLFKAKGF